MTEPTTERKPHITPSTSQHAVVSTTAGVKYTVSADSARMLELARDIAAMEVEETELRKRPSTSFRSLDDFERKLDEGS
jgi:hypothetical protein